jgi:hypothetical protein
VAEQVVIDASVGIAHLHDEVGTSAAAATRSWSAPSSASNHNAKSSVASMSHT